MKKEMSLLFTLIFLFGTAEILSASPTESRKIYEKNTPVKIKTALDKILEKDWKEHHLSVPKEASDAIFLRRASLILRGKLPSPEEASAYCGDSSPKKAEKMIEAYIASPEFADVRTMYSCDTLRVKSEFPINLWPNAVYVYRRRIHSFWRSNESYAHLIREFLLSSGSNFRIPGVNFYRASANRSPSGIASAAVLTLFGLRWETMPDEQKKSLTELFSHIKFKSTREWKEEIVYQEHPVRDIALSMPDGKKYIFQKSDLPGTFLADCFLARNGKILFARAFVNRIWAQFFSRGIVHEPDDMRPDNLPVNPELLDFLTDEFIQSDMNPAKLCRLVAESAAFRASSLSPEAELKENPEALKHFSRYPVTRLPAEILEDAICSITRTGRSYSSVIPEPFSYIPSNAPTVTLADGSITGSFLILFGRPARDSGLFSERRNDITHKQRQFLFNSGDLFRRVNGIQRESFLKNKPFRKKIEHLYLLFFSRKPSENEWKDIFEDYNARPNGRIKWQFLNELSWVLLNSNEFILNH